MLLIERKGARTAFITTEGFRDIIEQGYEKRFDHYDLMIDRRSRSCPAPSATTVKERLAANGDVLIPLQHAGLTELAEELIRQDVGAVAIGSLMLMPMMHTKRASAKPRRNPSPETSPSASRARWP